MVRHVPMEEERTTHSRARQVRGSRTLVMVRSFHLKIFFDTLPWHAYLYLVSSEVCQSGDINFLRWEQPLEESCGLPWVEDKAQAGEG
jgi:hypothetical protein